MVSVGTEVQWLLYQLPLVEHLLTQNSIHLGEHLNRMTACNQDAAEWHGMDKVGRGPKTKEDRSSQLLFFWPGQGAAQAVRRSVCELTNTVAYSLDGVMPGPESDTRQ